ncbi:MAG: hypothetical protein IPM20_14100 [Gammaproteobacteria bacterium]|nr:hypothetical protein [Gammaproteobacteria bacterium]
MGLVYRFQNNKKFFIEKGQSEKNHIKVFLGNKLSSEHDPTADGIWAEWEWDGIEFRFSNDRLGFYPIYYYSYEGKFGISTSIIDLVEKGDVPLDLDDQAVAFFIRMGFFLADDTPFKYIHSAPPACSIKWKDGRVEVFTKGCISSQIAVGLSRGAAIKEYGERFQNAINNTTPDKNEKVGVPLSGGRDSRHIALALYEGGVNIHSFLTVNKGQDLTVSRQVARELGIAQSVIYQKGSRFGQEIRKNYLTSFCADEHAWALGLANSIEENRYTVIYDGIGGDVLSASAFLNERRLDLYRKEKLEQLAEHLMIDEGYIRYSLPEDFYQRFSRERAVNKLTEELRKHVNTPNPVSQFFFWNRTRREIALLPWGLYRRDIKIMAPYLMKGIYDFLTGLPAEYMLNRQFHEQAINNQYAKHSHIPYEDKSVSTQRLCKQFIKTFREARLIKNYINYISISGVKKFDIGLGAHFIKLIGMYSMARSNDQFLNSLRRIIWLVQLLSLQKIK